MQSVKTSEFNQLLTGSHIIDFWAEWCGPFRALHPMLEKMEQEHDVTVYSVNVDEEPELAAQYKITSIPTLLKLEDGEKVKHLVGVRPYQQLVKELVND